jgi:hypothetical protein
MQVDSVILGIWHLGEAGCKLIVSSWGFGIWERQDVS